MSQLRSKIQPPHSNTYTTVYSCIIFHSNCVIEQKNSVRYYGTVRYPKNKVVEKLRRAKKKITCTGIYRNILTGKVAVCNIGGFLLLCKINLCDIALAYIFVVHRFLVHKEPVTKTDVGRVKVI